MKIRRLSEIDLARIAPLHRDEKLIRLRALKVGRPPHTYNPLRASLGDILNLQPEIFGTGGSYTPWKQIEADITRKSKSESEREFNLAVAEALYAYGSTSDVKSYSRPVPSWAVGYGQSISYWWNFYSVVGGEPCFMFVDPRISAPLTKVGRKFALSLMHERIRVPDPDFARSRLMIVQFAKGANGTRVLKLHTAVDDDLFSFDQLNEMIDETYRLWIQVLTERAEDAKKTGTGSTPMGF